MFRPHISQPSSFPDRTNLFYIMRSVSDIIYFLIQTDTNKYLLTHNIIPRPDCFDLRRCVGLRLSRCPFPLFSRATQGGIGQERALPAGCLSNRQRKNEKYVARLFQIRVTRSPKYRRFFCRKKRKPAPGQIGQVPADIKLHVPILQVLQV